MVWRWMLCDYTPWWYRKCSETLCWRYQIVGQVVHLSMTLARVSVRILRVCNKAWSYGTKWDDVRLAQSRFLYLRTQKLLNQTHWWKCLFRQWADSYLILWLFLLAFQTYHLPLNISSIMQFNKCLNFLHHVLPMFTWFLLALYRLRLENKVHQNVNVFPGVSFVASVVVVTLRRWHKSDAFWCRLSAAVALKGIDWRHGDFLFQKGRQVPMMWLCE